MSASILTLLIALPLVGAVAVAAARPAHDPAGCIRVGRQALAWSLGALVLAALAVYLFLTTAEPGGTGLRFEAPWVGGPGGPVDIRFHVAVDGLSLWLVVLAAGLLPLCIWSSFSAIRDRPRAYYALMLLLESGMIGVFCARDLLLFYVFFEFTLVPLFLLIGMWGGPRRHEAAATFFIYTMAGSMLTFAGVIVLAWLAWSLPPEAGGVGRFTFDLQTLYDLRIDPAVQWWLFIALAAGFAIKVPLFPFHTWLPLAHTEAPTAGSVLLAGVLLKLGTYGFLRLSLPMLPEASVALAPLLAGLAVIGILYGALAAWAQGDVKKLIAYSSVSHLGFCILGMFSLRPAGLTGSLLYMINHGLSTGALFLVVGMVYERYHTRAFDRLGGLARSMPQMAFFLVLFTLSSIGLPGLNGFVGEFLVLLGTFTSADPAHGTPAGPLGVAYAAFAALGIVLSALYMLSMCRRLLFGPLRAPLETPDRSTGLSPDLTGREIGVLAPLALACVFLGVYPRPVIETIQPAVQRQILDVMGAEPRQADPGIAGPAAASPWAVSSAEVADPPAGAAAVCDATARATPEDMP